MMFQMKVWNYHGGDFGSYVAGCYKVHPPPLPILPFAQPEILCDPHRLRGELRSPPKAIGGTTTPRPPSFPPG